MKVSEEFINKVRSYAERHNLNADIHSAEQIEAILSLNANQYDAIIDLIRTHDEPLAALMQYIHYLDI